MAEWPNCIDEDMVYHRTTVFKEDLRRAGWQPWPWNKAALNFIRLVCEALPRDSRRGFDLFPCDDLPVWQCDALPVLSTDPPLDIEDLAETLDSIDSPPIPFSWKMMLNGMDDETLDPIVGCGIVGFTCQWDLTIHDGKRMRKCCGCVGHVLLDEAMPSWNFVVSREDGSKVGFYPTPTNGKIVKTWGWHETCPYVNDRKRKYPSRDDIHGEFREIPQTPSSHASVGLIGFRPTDASTDASIGRSAAVAADLPQDPAAVAATAMLGRGTIGDNPNARAAQDVDRLSPPVHARILTFCATSPSERYVVLANTSRFGTYNGTSKPSGSPALWCSLPAICPPCAP